MTQRNLWSIKSEINCSKLFTFIFLHCFCIPYYVNSNDFDIVIYFIYKYTLGLIFAMRQKVMDHFIF